MSKELSRVTRQSTIMKASNYNSNLKKDKEPAAQNDVFWLTIKNKGFAYNVKQD